MPGAETCAALIRRLETSAPYLLLLLMLTLLIARMERVWRFLVPIVIIIMAIDILKLIRQD